MSNRKFYKKLPNGSFMEMESYEYYGTKKSFPYGLSAPRNLNKFKDIDLLNELHSDWYMPNNDGPRNESFYDLFDVNAKQLYFELHECLKDAKNNKKYEEQLIKIANHIKDGTPYKGLYLKRAPKSWKLSCANAENSWKAESEPIMSRAESTLSEGAETSGEVQSS